MTIPTDQPYSVVVGLGRSGIGAARLLRSQGRRVLVIESGSTAEQEAQARRLRQEGVEVSLATPLAEGSFSALAAPPERVVVSPGIRWDHPTLAWLRRRGVPVQGDMTVAWEAGRQLNWIGITGTNGKTTVTHLVSHLLRQAGLDAPMGGNVGRSLADLLLERRQPGGASPDWLVVELSSYQIEASPDVAPRIGIWTTLTPDHLERHGTLEHYRAIKRSLLERSATRLLNADDPDLRAHAASWEGAEWVTAGARQALPTSIDPLLWVEDGLVHSAAGALLPADCLPMPGAHNRQNMLLALATGLAVGLDPATMEAAFRRFPGVPHRLERIREHDGVTWFNDSKATNFDAAEVGLAAVSGPLVALAGGQPKQGGDPQRWLEQLRRQAAAVIVYGAAAEAFAALLGSAGYPGRVDRVEGLAEAVPLAAQLAGEAGCRAVLLSPACASFDQYSDFEARGEHFRSLVTAL